MESPRPFDPRAHIRQLRGKGGPADYLDGRWRLAWLRDEAPDSQIETELVQLGEGFAFFKATVTRIVDGEVKGRATGHGSETAADFRDFIEKAETKAIGRALNALGYSLEAANLDDGGPDDEAGEQEARRALSAEAQRLGIKGPQLRALRQELDLPSIEVMTADQCRALWRKLHETAGSSGK